MITNTLLLRAAAQQIDDLDGQARELANQKKDIYDNIKESVPPADFKAWKDAVKLRQKRRVKRDEIEAHDELVFAMLSMLEASTPTAEQKPTVTIEISSANGIQTKEAPTRARDGETYDIQTGEIDVDPTPEFLKRVA